MADAAVDSDFIPHINVQQRRKRGGVRPVMFGFFCSLLAFLLELSNPGYSRYKSSCLDVRPQTGDRLCNLVSFSIPQGFMGRCLTLLAGYLLASLKATFFFAYLSFRLTHVQSVHACRYARKTNRECSVRCKSFTGATWILLFPQGSRVFCFLKRRFTSSINL